MGLCSIRGAITAQDNTEEAILEASRLLITEMILKNNLDIDQIIMLTFTATGDLTKAYPAVSARALGITMSSIICCQEMAVEGSLPRCIRAMVVAECRLKQMDMQHVYLRDAIGLRPDLVSESHGSENVRTHAIAIDGPCGAGKSTVAKMVAEKLGFIYMDTGAMYRAAALYCLNRGVDLESMEEVAEAIKGMAISLGQEDGAVRVILEGADVTEDIKREAVADGASKVAMFPQVREALIGIQRQLAQKENVVMDGRDIGTTVLPDASLKVYLEASIHERAKRRYEEYKERGFEPDFEMVKKDLEDRDYRDTHRDVSPLSVAEDAVVLDSSEVNIGEVVKSIIEMFQNIIAYERWKRISG